MPFRDVRMAEAVAQARRWRARGPQMTKLLARVLFPDPGNPNDAEQALAALRRVVEAEGIGPDDLILSTSNSADPRVSLIATVQEQEAEHRRERKVLQGDLDRLRELAGPAANDALDRWVERGRPENSPVSRRRR